MDQEITNEMPHVLVFPYPAQGHINPVLPFSKSLASKGLKVTIIATSSVKIKSLNLSEKSSIKIVTISDGSEEVQEPEDLESYFNRIRSSISKSLAKFIDELNCSVKVIVYDSTIPWVLDIAHERGLLGAPFFTMSGSVCAVLYHLRRGSILFPYEERTTSFGYLPSLEMKDLPCFSKFDEPKHLVFKYLTDQFSNLEKADWIFVNTFDKLENEVLGWMRDKWSVKTVGPTLLLDSASQLPNDHKNQIISMFDQKNETHIGQWLDSKKTGSVVYVSLGSIASIGKEDMEELACGLMLSNYNFLWVVRASEQNKLPQNFTSLDSEKGLIVDWCSQTEVLAHRSVACFMTHCGWNSTLEALCCGVPIIAMAQWLDQQTNAKFVEDVWGVGIRAKALENGMVEREEIVRCIQEVSRGEKGNKLRKNAMKWKELANEAVLTNGSSAKNIDDFVSELLCCS